jgi:hypothetical protein
MACILWMVCLEIPKRLWSQARFQLNIHTQLRASWRTSYWRDKGLLARLS